MRISEANLRVIKDSRNQDTLESVLKTNEFISTASVPAGKSKGKFETTSVGPDLALSKFESIRDKLLDKDFDSILEFDNFLISLDDTGNKSNLGGNLILVLSIAFTKLLAKSRGLQTHELISQILGKNPTKFPYLYFNLIGGGLHASGSLPFQEYILVTKFPSPANGLEFAKSTIEKLRDDIGRNFGEIKYGDEGALIIKSDDPRVGLEVLSRNTDDPNVGLALDVAASTFFEDGKYNLRGKIMSSDELLFYYQLLATNYQLISIEDPFAEDDHNGFKKIVENLGDKIWIIADDLTVTNPDLIKKAQEEKAATGTIIKPNQIGSVSETLEAIKLAQSYNWKIIISHRSGETMDDFIADLAYGSEADGLKSGAPTQEVRLAKYNRLIEIEKQFNQ